MDTESIFEIEDDSGFSVVPLGVVIKHIKITTRQEQIQIKDMIVRIDFVNGDAMNFFKHLAKVIAR